MTTVFSNNQTPTNIQTPVVQPAPGEFVRSDAKVVAEMQQKVRARMGDLGILDEVQKLEMNPFRNFAWRAGAVVGFFRFWAEEASTLTDAVAKLRKGVQAVDPALMAPESQPWNVAAFQPVATTPNETKKAA